MVSEPQYATQATTSHASVTERLLRIMPPFKRFQSRILSWDPNLLTGSSPGWFQGHSNSVSANAAAGQASSPALPLAPPDTDLNLWSTPRHTHAEPWLHMQHRLQLTTWTLENAPLPPARGLSHRGLAGTASCTWSATHLSPRPLSHQASTLQSGWHHFLTGNLHWLLRDLRGSTHCGDT